MKAGAEEAAIFPVDLSEVDELEKFAQSVLEKYSKVDVLVNNAGMMPKTDGASGGNLHAACQCPAGPGCTAEHGTQDVQGISENGTRPSS